MALTWPRLPSLRGRAKLWSWSGEEGCLGACSDCCAGLCRARWGLPWVPLVAGLPFLWTLLPSQDHLLRPHLPPPTRDSPWCPSQDGQCPLL